MHSNTCRIIDSWHQQVVVWVNQVNAMDMPRQTQCQSAKDVTKTASQKKSTPAMKNPLKKAAAPPKESLVKKSVTSTPVTAGKKRKNTSKDTTSQKWPKEAQSLTMEDIPDIVTVVVNALPQSRSNTPPPSQAEKRTTRRSGRRTCGSDQEPKTEATQKRAATTRMRTMKTLVSVSVYSLVTL